MNRIRLTIQFCVVSVVINTLMLASACATTKPGMDDQVQVVMDKLTVMYGCKWQKNACLIKKIGGSVTLEDSPSTGILETVEMNALTTCAPQSCPNQTATSHDEVLRLVKYLVPEWADADSWFNKAFNDAAIPQGKDFIQLKHVAILVQWLQPADIEGTYAQIIITKDPSIIDEWKSRDN